MTVLNGGTYARHNGKAAARGAQCGAAVAGARQCWAARRWGPGQVYGGAAPFGLALVIGCPPSYCLAAALGTLAAGLAFQPMLLGVKLAVAAVAAAAVRRLIDGRPGAGALAGCLTLTAAQVLQIVLAGGTFQKFFPDRHGGVYGAAGAAVFGWAFAHFSGAGAARRLPVAGCGYGMPAALCRRALGSGPGAGAGGRAVRGHRRHAGADRRAEHCAGGGHHGVRADTGFCGAGRGHGEPGRGLPLPGERGAVPGCSRRAAPSGALAAPDAVSVLPLAVSAGVGVVAALAVPGGVMRKIFPPPAPPVQAQGLGGAARKLSAVADT